MLKNLGNDLLTFLYPYKRHHTNHEIGITRERGITQAPGRRIHFAHGRLIGMEGGSSCFDGSLEFFCEIVDDLLATPDQFLRDSESGVHMPVGRSGENEVFCHSIVSFSIHASADVVDGSDESVEVAR